MKRMSMLDIFLFAKGYHIERRRRGGKGRRISEYSTRGLVSKPAIALKEKLGGGLP